MPGRVWGGDFAACGGRGDALMPIAGERCSRKKCTGCHLMERSKVGPPMRGVFGHPAARDAHFPYSDELKAGTLVWDEISLDKWLADPDSLVPGNDMAFRVSSAADRADTSRT